MVAERKPAERECIYAHTTSHRNEDGRRGVLLHRALWIHHLPRPLLLCRLFGHKPVVDGTAGYDDGRGYRSLGYRWVCCDRCGTRPQPQGDLDAAHWSVGDRYKRSLPGPWTRATGSLRAEIVLGSCTPGGSVGIAVGSAGDDDMLSVHVRINPLGALYLNSGSFGTWFQRRLNPTGYDTRVIEAGVGDGRLRWRLWAKQGEHSSATPRWRDGTLVLDPRERLFGPRLYSYETVGETVAGAVRMPEGDDYEVVLTLQRVRHGRRRGKGKLSWNAKWASPTGITFRRDSWKGDETFGSAVRVSNAAVENGRWAPEACAAIAASISEMRTRYRWRPAAEEAEA